MDAVTAPLTAARRAAVLAAGVLLVVAASTIGLHDLAEDHLGAASAQHAGD